MTAVAALGIVFATPAIAGTFIFSGPADSCGTWTSKRQQGYAADDAWWLLGFLSGVGYEGPENPLNGVADGEVVWAWIDNYCSAHPLDALFEAAKAFVREHPR